MASARIPASEPLSHRQTERWCWLGPVGYGRPRIRKDQRAATSEVSSDEVKRIFPPSLNWPVPSPTHFTQDWNEHSFELHRVDSEVGDVEYLLNEEDIAFVLKHCRCFYCDRPFQAPLSECVCDKTFWDGRCNGDIHAVHPKCAKGLVQRLIDRRKAQRTSANRAGLLRASEGKHVTALENAALYRAQAGLCYYCGVEMVQSGPGRCHHDHFVPLVRGGRRDLENSVLACPRCNLHKNDDTGLSYLARRDRRKSDNPAQLTRMRRAFNAWRKERGFPPFKDLVSN